MSQSDVKRSLFKNLNIIRSQEIMQINKKSLDEKWNFLLTISEMT